MSSTWRSKIGIAALVLAVAGLVYGQAALLNESQKGLISTETFKEFQLFRCDNSASIAGIGDSGGVICESGDWSSAVDCRGFTQVTLHYFEYGAGSGRVRLWNCVDPVGSPTTKNSPLIAGVTIPGVEDPSSAPSAADPDPLCVDLVAGAGATVIGTVAGTQQLTISDVGLNYLVGEIDDCTGNCDGTFHVSCAGGPGR